MEVAGAILDHGVLWIQENWLFLLVVIAAFAVQWRTPRSVLRRFDLIANHRFAGCLLVVAVSLLFSVTKSARDGTPQPQYHDDYAYLLAADTFAHGRVANPVHPFAEHFETMHVLQGPRYVAKFPPGQGLLLTGGKAAIWLATAAACAALWGAMRVWLGVRLALLGGLAAAMHPTMLHWSQVDHGGELAALAGALLFGAAGVLRERSSRRAAAVAGVALALLAVSRPYEGLVFAVAMLVVVRPRFDKAYLVGALTAIVALLPLALYNRAITGSAFTLPYSIYEQRYDPVPNFLWESPRTVSSWPNKEMSYNYQIVYADYYRREMAPGGLTDAFAKRVDVIRFTLFGPVSWLSSAWCVLLLPLLALPRALARRREVRLLALALLVFAFAPFSVTWWLQPHYLAPAAALAATLLILLLAELGSMKRGGLLAAAVILVFAVDAIGSWAAPPAKAGIEPQRQSIEHSLAARGGRHVILVAPEVFDAVYNSATIDTQPVIWARDLGAPANARLLAYYANRQAWTLTRGPSGLVLKKAVD